MDSEGYTALMYAALACRENITGHLIEVGANTTLRATGGDFRDKTILEIMRMRRNASPSCTKVVALLELAKKLAQVRNKMEEFEENRKTLYDNHDKLSSEDKQHEEHLMREIEMMANKMTALDKQMKTAKMERQARLCEATNNLEAARKRLKEIEKKYENLTVNNDPTVNNSLGKQYRALDMERLTTGDEITRLEEQVREVVQKPGPPPRPGPPRRPGPPPRRGPLQRRGSWVVTNTPHYDESKELEKLAAETSSDDEDLLFATAPEASAPEASEPETSAPETSAATEASAAEASAPETLEAEQTAQERVVALEAEASAPET